MIFFDIDGTLVDHEEAERNAALTFKRSHADVFQEAEDDFVRRWHSLAEKYFQLFLAGELSLGGQRRARMREFFAERNQLSDLQADELFHEYLAYYEESWSLFPDVENCLSSFGEYDLGVISNGDPTQQRQKLNTLGIASSFSVILISGDVGLSKPDPGIFAAACRKAGVSPSACFYVGDNLENDAEASVRAGLIGIWLNRDGLHRDSTLPTISSLTNLNRVVGNIMK